MIFLIFRCFFIANKEISLIFDAFLKTTNIKKEFYFEKRLFTGSTISNH